MFGAFQSNGFQGNAYQILFTAVASTPAPNGNRDRREYVSPHYELQERKRLEAKKVDLEGELRAKQYRLEELELKRLREGLDDQKLQLELLELLKANYLQEQELLRITAQIQLMIYNEEVWLVLMMSNPF